MTNPIDADRLTTSEPVGPAEREKLARTFDVCARGFKPPVFGPDDRMAGPLMTKDQHELLAALLRAAPSPGVRSALEGLVEAVRRDSDEDGKGISGFTSARLSDAVAAISHPAPQDEMRRALKGALFPPDIVEDGGKCITTLDASYNLEGALIDIERLAAAGKPVDEVCISTIRRVIEQIEAARAAIKQGSGEDE